MQENELIALYSVLGLQPDCSWDELRKAYRSQSRQWHPDRYALPSEHRFATERMKAINHAYAELSRFHRIRRGPTSGTDLPGHEQAHAPGPPRTEASAPTHPAPASERPEPSWTYAPERARPTSRLSIRLSAVVLGLAAVYGYVVFDSSSHPDRTDSDPMLEAAQHAEFSGFTYGATLAQLAAAQGQPDHIEAGVWYFGNSRVFFSDGVVTGWDERPDSPLHLSKRAPSAVSAPNATFQKGSTMAQVRAAQGAPDRASETTWEYGLSKIHFKDGRVLSWHESPLTPLRVKR